MVKKAGIILTRKKAGNEQVYVVIQRFYPGYNKFLVLLEDIITSDGSNTLDDPHKTSLTEFKKSIIDLYGIDEQLIPYTTLIYITDNIIKPFLIHLLLISKRLDYEISDKRYGFSSVISLPKGSIDIDIYESSLDCAIREFREETGLMINKNNGTQINKNISLSNNYIEYYNIDISNIDNPADVKLCKKYSITVPSASSGNGMVGNTISSFFISIIETLDVSIFNLDTMSELKRKYDGADYTSVIRKFEIIDSGFIDISSEPHGSRTGSLSPDVKNINSGLVTLNVKGGSLINISKKNKKRTKNKSKKNKKV